MSGKAKQLFEYAHRLEQVKVDLIQFKLGEASRSLEPVIEILRKEAEIELMQYINRYGED